MAHPDQLHLVGFVAGKSLHAAPAFIERIVEVINDGHPVVVVQQIQHSVAACVQPAGSDQKTPVNPNTCLPLMHRKLN